MNDPYRVSISGNPIPIIANSGGGSSFQFRTAAHAVGEIRTLTDGTVVSWDGIRWNEVLAPAQAGGGPVVVGPPLDLNASPADALALAIFQAFRDVPGSNMPAARKSAADVVKSLAALGFSITLNSGSVREVHREEDFDFSDICSPCGQATDAYAAWHMTPETRKAEMPDRFCIFHRGYVMGKLA